MGTSSVTCGTDRDRDWGREDGMGYGECVNGAAVRAG